uniref:SSD domain-containing protein n=1 Tax=Clastoptera arizonana TaxID=38151 RepID=A0A1B6DUL2_9HEMI
MVCEQTRHQTDLYVRPSWIDARLALAQIDKGKAEGRRTALWFRARLQAELFQLGCFLQRHAGKVLFVAILVLLSFCVGLKSAVLHSRVEDLWVEEGGRLEGELRYTQDALGETSGSTHQFVIQTPRDPHASLLHPGALLSHLEVVKAATSVEVHLFDITWRLKDMCYAPSLPNFDLYYIDQIFENIIPCAIITPLDCFWEGSKLLGPSPDSPVTIPHVGNKVKWTNLNPMKLMENLKSMDTGFSYSTLEQHMKRAGISTGYQEKPCIDPNDKECPDTAPNKGSRQVPDIGAELTGGCYGFAAKFMHWPEDLIIGGTKRNKTGRIYRANALQTVVQLMGEKELYDFWLETYKVHHVDWNQEKAALVLKTWQRRFAEEVKKFGKKDNLTTPYNFLSFSTATLNDILSRFSELDLLKVAAGYLILLIYAGMSLLKWQEPVKSQSALGFAGIILVFVTVAAGLGFCAVLGIAFNATSTQLVPFITLGLCVDDMFLLTHIYARQVSSESHPDEQIGVLLKKTGLTVLTRSLSNACASLAAAVIPIPALRVFSLQVSIVILFSLATTLIVYPALISLDLRRKRSGRVDLLCCCLPGSGQWPCFDSPAPKKRSQIVPEKLQAITRALPPDRQQTVTVLAPPKVNPMENHSEGREDLCENPPSLLESLFGNSMSLRHLAQTYANIIIKSPIKFTSIVFMMGLLVGSLYGFSKVGDGLNLTDLVPRGSMEYAFLDAHSKYFGFYNMHAVTQKDFEYPTNQKLLHEYHEAFMRVKNVIKNDDGGLPEFWLGLFRDWLLGLQKAFDKDWKNGCIVQERWFSNASDDGILAYKLLVQTGHVDNPIDKSLVTQVRLVDYEGIINPKGFYNYLSAWTSNDALAYGASQANFRPEPKQWFHVAKDVELKIPKSAPLIYTQLPFYLHSLRETKDITHLVSQVRDLCQRYELRGLPNFPSGIPFLFWEPFLRIRLIFALSVLCALSAVFTIMALFTFNLWAATIVTGQIASMVLQIIGVMGLFGIKLSAITCVILIIAVGISANFTIQMCLSFLTCVGNRDRRTRLAVDHMFTTVMHGGLTLALSISILFISDFDFVVKYFFSIVFALVGIGLFNGLLFFPVLLSLIGPEAEVIPITHPERMSTPSPEPIRRIHQPACRIAPPPKRQERNQREPSLTTITEEPGSWHSQTHEIVVEPAITVETTTCTHPHTSSSGSETSSSSQRASPQPSRPHVTTKVTATAKVKVEVHTPIHTSGSMDMSSSKTRSHSRRHSRDSSSDSSDSSGRHS